MYKKRFALALLAAGLGMSGAAQAALINLVVNGGFESPAIAPPYALSVNPTGWTGLGDLVVQGYAGAMSSGDGNQWLDLNPGTGPGTGMSQDITLTAGKTYQFSFLYNGGGGGTTTQIAYSLGSSLSGNVSTASMNVYGGTPWATFSTSFTPTVSGAETLNFVPNGVWSGGFIDAVNISAVPLPAAVWLLGSGLIGMVGVARRRKCNTAGKMMAA